MSQLRRSMSRSKIEVASRLCQKIGGDTDGDNRQPPQDYHAPSESGVLKITTRE